MADSESARARPLSVAATTTDGIYVLTVAGEIDHYTAPPVRQALDLSRLGSPPRVVIDLRQVTFMDSTLGALRVAERVGHGGYARENPPRSGPG